MLLHPITNTYAGNLPCHSPLFPDTKTVSHDPNAKCPHVQPMFPLPGFTRPPFMAPALVRFGFTDAGCNGLGGFRRISQLRETAYSNRQDQIGKG